MRSSINAIHAAGNSVGFVSLLIGGNDILVLGGTSAFRNASPAEQQAMVASTIGAVQERYLAVLTELKSLAPEAAIFLPGYYNPFPSGLPEKTFYDSVLAAFNPIVAADAAAFGATYVDLQGPFTGREFELTNIATGDVHPNQAGYAVIAGRLQAAVVPEPGSLALLASGGAAGALWAAARRRARPSRAAAA
jgi:lysophospholipase L1-like esterase